MDAARLQAVISAELAAAAPRSSTIDARLAGLVDLLVDFVTAGGKRLRPEFLWCGWIAAGGRRRRADDRTPCCGWVRRWN